MNDSQTRSAYASNAAAYSDDWLAQPPPTDMYDLLIKHFVPGTVADIGCGNGRDAAWLFARGFAVSGFDASVELVEIARATYAGVSFAVAELPSLSTVHGRFDNVLCETVVMHLPTAQLPEAVARLKSLVKPGGVLYLSWRVTEGEDVRHADGRLYSAFDPLVIQREFAHVLHFEDGLSVSSGKRVCRLIARL